MTWPEFVFFSPPSSLFRWPEFGFCLPSSVFRWPELHLSYITTGWSLQSLRSWLDFSVDNVIWPFIKVVETTALLAMLCYFFFFCGCTL